MTRRGTASIVASPVLVGAVTVLIIVVSVFLAYNANQGLPFVPTYDIKAEMPSGANLVVGNEVRVGGFRVGTVDEITPRTVSEGGDTRSVAVIDMSLDKVVEPLATDTQVLVRPRSALGLKYVELTPGAAESTFAPGDTIPLANAGDPVEFDDFLNTFDQDLRDDSRAALTGFGDALAGRGQSINVALGELPEFFGSLTTVMDTLNDDSTELDQFFVQIGRTAAQVAPVLGRPGGPVHEHGRHLRGLLAQPRRRSRRRSRAPRRRSRRASRASPCSARSWPTSPSSRTASARPPRSCRARCRRSTRRSAPARTSCRRRPPSTRTWRRSSGR